MKLPRQRKQYLPKATDGYIVRVTNPMRPCYIESYTTTFVRYDTPFLIAKTEDGVALFREQTICLPIVEEPKRGDWIFEWRGKDGKDSKVKSHFGLTMGLAGLEVLKPDYL